MDARPKRTFAVISILLAVSSVACHAEDSCDRGDPSCSIDAGQDPGEQCDPAIDPDCVVDVGFDIVDECDPETDPFCIADVTVDGSGDQTQQFMSYYYVLVEDMDPTPGGDTPGANIDAVSLTKGSVEYPLSQIHEAAFGTVPPNGDNRSFNNVLGTPESTCNLTDSGTYDTFISLGGEGGYIIGSFGALEEIETGDTITVFACTGTESAGWNAVVGVASSISDANWVLVIADATSTTAGTVPTLPLVPIH